MSVDAATLRKSPTGVQGLDEILGGGVPTGRPTLVCGSAGCGKTLLAMEFIERGAREFDEPGVFMAFEETARELTENVSSLGFDLDGLVQRGRVRLDHVHVERAAGAEAGDYDLEGLFIRLGHAIDAIGAKRVVLDSLELLFAGLGNPAVLRSELHRLFRWLKDRGVTTIVTGERGDGTLTRHGLEEYVSDCVILLDHRVTAQVSTRRLRVVKYRGSVHGTNEYPFLIDRQGIAVLPITSVGLDHVASTDRIASGVPRLDTMLGGKGYYRGSSVLVSGTAGTGKSSLAAHFVDAACRRGERSLYFAFEEAPNQIVRNMRSIGIDLAPWVSAGLLRFHSARPSICGLEMHLTTMHQETREFEPAVVVVDPVNSFTTRDNYSDVKAMLVRLVDFLKQEQITSVFTSLTTGQTALESTDVEISSLIDTWLLVRDIEANGERNRGLHILKSRGMAHSNQVREFVLTDEGIELKDVYVGPDGVLTGSARLAREAAEQSVAVVRQREMERKQRDLARRRAALEARIAAMRAEFAQDADEALLIIDEDEAAVAQLAQDRIEMARNRRADADVPASDR